MAWPRRTEPGRRGKGRARWTPRFLLEALGCTIGPVSEKEFLTAVGQSSRKYLCFGACVADGGCSDDLLLLTRHSQVAKNTDSQHTPQHSWRGGAW